MNKSMTRLVVALIAFLLVAVVAVPIVQGVINNKQSTDIGGGKDGKDGEDGITPQLRINYNTNEWEYSYTQGVTWQSLGVKATGAAGKDGADGKDGQDGQDGKDGVSPRIRINTSTSEWEISTDEGLTWESTGVKASGEVTASLTIDSELSTTSDNAVQNKVITQTLNELVDQFETALANVSSTVPTFDLAALGLPPLAEDGSAVVLETDTTEIMTALEKGPVKFIVSLDNGDSTSTNLELVVNSVFLDGMFVCSQTFDFTGDQPFMFTIMVREHGVGVCITDLFQSKSQLPEVSTDDDGKGLIVQDGEWVVGELPETPTQEKTIEITESGTYEITPDAGFALSKVLATVNVAQTGGESGGDATCDGSCDAAQFNLRLANAMVSRNPEPLGYSNVMDMSDFRTVDGAILGNLRSFAFAGFNNLEGIKLSPQTFFSNQYIFYGCDKLKIIDYTLSPLASAASFWANSLCGFSSLEAIIIRTPDDVVLDFITFFDGSYTGNENFYVYVPRASYERVTTNVVSTNTLPMSRIRILEDYPDIDNWWDNIKIEATD